MYINCNEIKGITFKNKLKIERNSQIRLGKINYKIIQIRKEEKRFSRNRESTTHLSVAV